jgi:hypothetical protein
MWTPDGCHTYLHVDTASEEASTYVQMAAKIEAMADHVSASVYTQTTDLENEYVPRCAAHLSRLDAVVIPDQYAYACRLTRSTPVLFGFPSFNYRCDGFLNYDRTSKFSDADTKAIKAANLKIRAVVDALNTK